MRSARLILATAAASAALALGAPGAYAAGGDWDHDDSSYSDGSSHGKEHGKHESPHGGMHTGGGALTAVNDHDDWGSSRDPKTDPDTYKDNGGKSDWGDRDGGGRGGDSWGGGHEKPSGGMHTGGGALATPTATAGGLAVLAVAATGLYAARRKKPVGNPA
ncbi:MULTISPECIES: hypothetical protein [Streptomyces]|jgi:hypothetical protein|uniref:LPXTG cell wall anchor domain-containing protein n=1 Tax=Streptomyces spinosisporus TaxID=2927582 RepID=A0ABS9XKW6_9ACTN|nr:MULTISPECIES: hypothetical protein [Streptomyces]EPD62172.1 hypothetical protein HMPREF1211_03806 [Streptomyces sp. HGB0020]MCI3242732.1 hypothetical protein [Streptomyces spinosisporus]WUB40110.1 hypothetical protein OHN38_36285 [Streptomyces sp. NBC_00588]